MNLMIVESKAKAKTIRKYLDQDWIVLATGGHIQELPPNGQAFWANRAGELPKPRWAWTEHGEQAVGAIRAAAKQDHIDRFALASDPDREGEFIAWRLSELLADLAPCERLTFQEVTAAAIKAAIAQPRSVDMQLVESAMVRMFLDRLVGFRTSKTARKFVTARTASMGRVQTPTLGFVVDRELEREAHVPKPYFEIRATASDIDFHVRFHEPHDPLRWEDDEGRHDPSRTADVALAERSLSVLQTVSALTVTDAKITERSESARSAFTTDALLQAAGSRWGWTPRKTSKLASDLYEGGHITYIRTDSTRLSREAVDEARRIVAQQFGHQYLGGGVVASPSAGKIQDAHEAIRPTNVTLAAVNDVDEDSQRLYALIRAQTLASQMAPARRATLRVTATAEGLDRLLMGAMSWYVDLGWRAAFRAFDEPATSAPRMVAAAGEQLPLSDAAQDTPNPFLVRGQTEPPPRYRAHSLIKSMKEEGIGRPSTYASTVETLLERRYVVDRDHALAPTVDGRNIWLRAAPLYVLGDGRPLLDVAYTAEMENHLDRIANGYEAASLVWEQLRDEVRAAHETARKKALTGQATPKQIQALEALLGNAPDVRGEVGPPEVLTAERASDWIAKLHARGVLPAPSERQLAEVARLFEKTGLSLEQAALRAELPGLTFIRTRGEASAIIEVLRAQLERGIPSSVRSQ